jgi:hypothetical protein
MYVDAQNLIFIVVRPRRVVVGGKNRRYVRQRTDPAKNTAYKLIHRGQYRIRFIADWREMMTTNPKENHA